MSRKTIDGLSSFAVDGQTYRFELMPPLECMAFGTRVLKAAGGLITTLFADGEKLTPELVQKSLSVLDPVELSLLMREALSKCYTPTGASLSDETQFNQWFMEHPEQMFIAGVHAIYNQVKDFFPSLPGTTAKS